MIQPNAVLERIIATGKAEARDGRLVDIFPTGVSADVGHLIQELVVSCKAVRTLEIGMAQAVSTLYICDALKDVPGFRHTAIDPYQNYPQYWDGLGLKQVRDAGYGPKFRLIENWSFSALPTLIESNETFDFIFIDGDHSFEHVFSDAYFADSLLKVGGILVFDDAEYPDVAEVCSFVEGSMHYRNLSVEYAVPGRCRAFEKLKTTRRQDIASRPSSNKVSEAIKKADQYHAEVIEKLRAKAGQREARSIPDLAKNVEVGGFIFDEFGRRYAPPIASAPSKFAVFFGDSLTLGDGLAASETLPALFETLNPDFRSYNYGSFGQGPQYLLTRLQKTSLASELIEQEGIFVFSLRDAAVSTAAGKAPWCEGSPRYEIGPNGFLLDKGMFSKDCVPDREARPDELTAKDLELTVKILAAIDSLIKELFPQCAFYVLQQPIATLASTMVPLLQKAGLCVINLAPHSEKFRWCYANRPADGKHSAAGNDFLARQLGKLLRP